MKENIRERNVGQEKKQRKKKERITLSLTLLMNG